MPVKGNLIQPDVFTICMNTLYLISWWAQSKELRVSVPLPCFPVEAVQLLVTAESRQSLHSLIRGQVPQAEVRGSQCMTRVITQACEGRRFDLEQRHKQRRGRGR